MPRNYIRKKKKCANAILVAAVEEVMNGASLYMTSKKYPVSYGTLQRLVQRKKNNQSLFPPRCLSNQTALPSEVEMKLVGAVHTMKSMGLSPSISEFRGIVKDYINQNNIETLFKDGKPGAEWARLFMDRHHIKLKRGVKISTTRKRNEYDPFVIYNFYDMVQKLIEELGIQNRPECIWNLSEMDFPLDVSNRQITESKGEKSEEDITCASNEENITVLSCCCANGSVMDPVIINKGERLHESWMGRGSNMLHQIRYFFSDSGWMTAGIFEEFFKIFVRHTKEIRPILLIIDGYLTYTSIKTIEMAVEENITLLKLPFHCADLFQQSQNNLGFGALRSYYESELTSYLHDTDENDGLPKSIFVNILCKIWKKGLSKSNIIAGFKATGIFPTDHEKYDTSSLDRIKLQEYREWVEKGKPETAEGVPMLEENDTQVHDPDFTSIRRMLKGIPTQFLIDELQTRTVEGRSVIVSLSLNSAPTMTSRSVRDIHHEREDSQDPKGPTICKDQFNFIDVEANAPFWNALPKRKAAPASDT